MQYLMALRSHLLQAAILYESPTAEGGAMAQVSPATYHDSLEVSVMIGHGVVFDAFVHVSVMM